MKFLEKIIRLNTYKVISLISLLIVCFAGIIPSFLLEDWGWFSRSGALLIIFAIFIVWLDYKGSINNALDRVLSGFDDYLKKEKIESHEKIKRNISLKFDEVRDANKRMFNKIEFFIVGIGTLIWAYGDLINKFYA